MPSSCPRRTISRTASEDDIHKAFRQLAKKYHPDLNPGDKTAEAKFKDLNEAYQVLSDGEKRAAYDRFGHQAFQNGTGGRPGAGSRSMRTPRSSSTPAMDCAARRTVRRQIRAVRCQPNDARIGDVVVVRDGDVEQLRAETLPERCQQRVVHALPWGDVVWHVWRPVEGSQVRPKEPAIEGTKEGTKEQVQEHANVSAHVHEPLVLLHGGSGSWTHWVRNVQHLSRQRTVWALDLPGFGDSALPSSVRDADDLVPYLDALLQHAFGNQKVDVMGFSFGGMTAGLLAATPGHTMRRLMLVGVPGLGLMQQALPMRGMLPSMTRVQEREVHRHNLNAMMLHHASSVTEELIDLQEANVARDRMRRRRIARTDVLAQAQARWQIPVSGVWGQEDALYRGALSQIAERLPNMTSPIFLEDAGHWVMYERPEAFHAVADAWLAQPLDAKLV